MDSEEFSNLLNKIRSGSASSDEIRIYNRFFMSFQDDISWREKEMGNKNDVEKEIHQNILSVIKRPAGRLKFTLMVKFAAAAVLLLTVISILVKVIPIKNNVQNRSIAHKGNEITNKNKNVTLELGDGRIINLDSFNTGKILKEAGVQIKKTADGQIVYHILPAQSSKQQGLENIISTSRGKQYQINLPDGTIVWLNAESSLSYPIAFAANERVVKLKGEAFFKVAKNKKQPFIVSSNGQEVKVFGTQFNLSAYPEDDKITTTLVEGSVQIKNKLSKSAVMLNPGDQSFFWDNRKEIPVSHLSAEALENAIAWKSDYFSFDNEDILSISKKLARWYDVDFVFKGKVTEEEFNGTISRTKNLVQVLDMLQNTGEVRFEVQGRRVFVMQ